MVKVYPLEQKKKSYWEQIMLLKWNIFSCVVGLFVFHFLLGGREMMGKSGPKMKFCILECYFKDYLLSEYSEV